MNKDTSRRVAVTGLGIITSIGDSVPAFREELFNGKCGIGPISLFDTSGFSCHSAGQIKDIDLEGFFNSREIKRNSRCDLLGLIAADEALSDSGLDIAKCTKEKIGVVLGGGAGGMLSWEKYRRALWLKKTRPRPSLLLPTAPCTLTDLVASRYKLTGLRATICTACSSSATSIGYGFDLIRSGDQDIVVTGGSESLSELTFSGGAAILILEDYKRAEDRNAIIYAEVLGYATNSDAVHITSPDAEGMSRVMVQALKNANVDVDQVDYINAHGTATRINDQMETRAIKKVFNGECAGDLTISSTKSMVGHCLGAAGAIEGVATVLALHEQVVPPTIHLEVPDPDCDLDYVPDYSRKKEIDFAMSNSFAFGGNNTSVVFARSKV